MPVHPTWAQVQSFAAKLNQPGKLAGVCLRGLAGWGATTGPPGTLPRPLGGAGGWKLVSWATSKAYDQLVANKYGWAAVPPGTRTSLYNTPGYQQAAKAFASITLASIDSVNPQHPTVNPVPYVGIQYVDIPQFETLGLTVAQQIAGAIAGTETVSQALKTSQAAAAANTPAQLSGH